MNNLVKSIAVGALLVAASSAQAVIIEEQWVNYDPLIGGGEAEYTVTNDSTSSIYAFVVANDAVTDSWSNNNGWESSQVDAAYWDNANSSIKFSGIVDPVYTASLGAFDSLFTGFSQATMYI